MLELAMKIRTIIVLSPLTSAEKRVLTQAADLLENTPSNKTEKKAKKNGK